MRILIIEDEPLAARRLEGMMKVILNGDLSFVQTATIEETLQVLKNGMVPDLILSDIHLTDGYAFEIFKEHPVETPLIFCTAYDQYALEAFQHSGQAYLLKPVEAEALRVAVHRVLKSSFSIDYDRLAKAVLAEKESGKKRLLLRVGQVLKPVELDDIAYFLARDKTVYLVQTNGKKYPVDDALDQLELSLDSNRFFRINRRYLTTVQAIQSLYAWSRSRIRVVLHPDPEDEVLISSERVAGFKAWHERAS